MGSVSGPASVEMPVVGPELVPAVATVSVSPAESPEASKQAHTSAAPTSDAARAREDRAYLHAPAGIGGRVIMLSRANDGRDDV